MATFDVNDIPRQNEILSNGDISYLGLCCGEYATCKNTSPCRPRQFFREQAKNTDVQAAVNAATHGSEPMVMPSNPKQAYGDTKVPLHLFPNTAIAGGAMAFLEGKGKYGDCNFRAAPVEAMTYVRATESHMKAWAEGQDIDPDSGLDHLFKALACIAILIDAKYAGSLVDNRKFPGGYHKLMDDLVPHVSRLREMHADKNPKHYSIKDAA